MPLSAIALNCSLKSEKGDEASSTDKMIGLIAGALKGRDVRFDGTIRLADHDVKPGVTSDEGEGDAWPLTQAYPGGRHPDLRHADLDGPDVEHRQARVRADGRLPFRDR